MEKITSLTNDKIKYFVKLKDQKFRNQERKFLVEGDHLVAQAYKLGILKELLTTDSNCNYPNAILVTEEILKKVSFTKSPQKVIGLCDFIENKEKLSDRIIILDGIQDPSNAGAIIRSALAFGFNSVIFSSDSVDIYNDKFIRASKGSFLEMNILREDLTAFYPLIKKDYQIVATALENGKAINEIKYQEKLALVIGNEGNGISQLTKKMADNIAYIPISQKIESLNAAVAAGIMMFYLSKNY